MTSRYLMHPDFREACIKYRGRVLTGEFAHWCNAWDGLPVDETCEEWPCECGPSGGVDDEEEA